MITIGSDKTIISGHASFAAGSDCLLTIVKMAEATNLSLLVKLIREDFHSAHDSHLIEEGAKLLLGDSGLRREILGIKMVCAENSGLNYTIDSVRKDRDII